MARIDQIRKLLQSDPDDVFLNFSLAMEYNAAGQVDEALSQFDRTIALDANYLAAYDRKGHVLLAARRMDEARRALEAGAQAARAVGDRHMLDNFNETLSHLP